MSDGPAKEPKEELSVSGSEEEADDLPDADSDDDLSDLEGKEEIHEMEGSVDEDSTKSDEEYEDLAMRDGIANGYSSDDDEEPTGLKNPPPDVETILTRIGEEDDNFTEKYQHNLDLFLKMREGDVKQPYGRERGSNPKLRKRSMSDSMRLQSRGARSFPAVGESVSLYSN